MAKESGRMTVTRVFWSLWRNSINKWKPTLMLFVVVIGFSSLRTLIYVTNTNPVPDIKPMVIATTPATKQSLLLHQRNSLERFSSNKTELDLLERSIKQRRKRCPRIVQPLESEIKYRNGYWQRLEEKSNEIFVITAFYDDRPIVGLLPLIRIHAVDKTSGELHCHVWYKEHTQPYITPATVTSTGRGEIIDGVRYKQNLYSCPLPVSYPIPTHVSIATGACRNSTIFLPITVPIRSGWTHEFGICVAIAFGAIPIEQIVEWVEFNMLLGVKEFNIYDGNLAPNMSDVLQYYSDKDVMRVYSMPPPVMDFTKKGVKLSSPASLNDCMLRNMYRYRYIIVIDFDEIIIPNEPQNYTQMLQAIDAMENLTHPWQSYTFRNVYHFNRFPEDTSQPDYLRTMRRRDRVNPSRYLVGPKSFIDPKSCLSVFNHYCWKRFPFSDKRWTIDVKSAIAVSHHYRDCPNSRSVECDKQYKERHSDDTVLLYKEELQPKVENVLLKLNKLKS